MTRDIKPSASPESGDLFHRVVSILEQAKTNVVRIVNNEKVRSWLVYGGKEEHSRRNTTIISWDGLRKLLKAR